MKTSILLAILGLVLVIVGETSARPERGGKETPAERVARQKAAAKDNPPPERHTGEEGDPADATGGLVPGDVSKAAGPATGAAGPATGAAGPATGAATKAAGPATKAAGPATKAAGPATKAAEPATNAAKPATGSAAEPAPDPE